MAGIEQATRLLPFATSDVPGYALTRNTASHWSVRLWGHLGPLWADGFSMGLSEARISILRGYARQDATGRWIADFLIAPEEGALDPAGHRLPGPRLRRSLARRCRPVVLTHFALDGSPDLGSVLYLEVRGPDRIGFLGSLLRVAGAPGPRPAGDDDLHPRRRGGRPLLPADGARAGAARRGPARSRAHPGEGAGGEPRALGRGVPDLVGPRFARRVAALAMIGFSAPLAQLDRATDYESVGRTFESCRAHHHQINSLGGARKRPLFSAGSRCCTPPAQVAGHWWRYRRAFARWSIGIGVAVVEECGRRRKADQPTSVEPIR